VATVLRTFPADYGHFYGLGLKAAEKLTAQSEAMNGVVDQLVEIVGGNGSKH
jgi:hypothetical protein